MTARFITAEEITDSFSFLSAVNAIEEALLGGLDPAGDLPRSILPIEKGELLLMPSTSVEGSGIKVLTIAPNNPTLNEPRIQGIYLLFDKDNLAISSILDGAALTTYRTPAISFAAVRKGLELSRNEISVVLFGSGPQAISHIQTLAALDVKVTSVVFVVRDIEKAEKRVPDVALLGLTSECTIHILGADSHEVNQHLQQADLVIAATTARTPLFDSTLLKQSVIVIAVGSHEPDVREIDSNLLARAQVVVETRASALREAGDVIMAIGDGSITAQSLHELADVVCGRTTLNREQPIFFKSSGMSWEDLVIARAIERDCRTSTTS
jgi:ornithine cyclodeaminase